VSDLARRFIVGMGVVGVGVWSAAPALAQQGGGDEGPEPRVMTVTTFDVPWQDRGEVFPFMRKYVLPTTQLNPKVINFRVMIHNWGSDASQVVIAAEYARFEDIQAECGQPCDDYEKAHAAPKEGEDGYDAFVQARDLFLKYYGRHRDEIYVSFMDGARVEGTMMGTVGLPEDQGNGGGE